MDEVPGEYEGQDVIATEEDETLGVGNNDDDETPGVGNNDDDETSGVGNNDSNDENEAANKSDKVPERTSGTRSLRRQKRVEYNNMLNINDVTENEDITLLQLNPDSCDITENTFNDVEAEYIFLTETLGWKQGLIEAGIEDEPEKNPEGDTNNANKLAEYLFLTE